MTPRRAVLLLMPLVASLFVWSAELTGQAVSARALIAAPKSSVRLGGVTERVDGVWGGLAVEFDAGRFMLSASGTRGQLTPSEAGTLPTRDVGELSLSGRYDVRPWLEFEVGYAARAFRSAAGYQRWDVLALGGAVSRDLGTPAVRAFAGLAYLPIVRVSQQERPTFALRSHVGISLVPNRFPVAFLLGYRVERFRFPESALRSEQFETLTLSVGVRARRLDGRWRLGG